MITTEHALGDLGFPSLLPAFITNLFGGEEKIERPQVMIVPTQPRPAQVVPTTTGGTSPVLLIIGILGTLASLYLVTRS